MTGETSHAELRAAADDLRDELAAAVLAVDGVVRMEPTLRNALQRLHAGTTVLLNQRGVRSAADGIELHRRADVVDVRVELATAPSRPAALTARQVREALAATLRDRGLRPGRLSVAVLSVER